MPFVIESKARVNNVYVDSNEIKTVYGKSGLTEYLNRYTSDKSLNRIKIKRSPSSSRTAPIAAVGLQTSSNPTVPQSKPVVKKDSMQNDQNNSSPTIKSSRKGADNFATERKQSKDRQVVFRDVAQEQANEIEAKLKEALGENADLRKQLKEANRKKRAFQGATSPSLNCSMC